MEGVRILDFTQEIQGPWGTAILADMGAEVFKIERRETGEPARHAGLRGHPELQGISPYLTVLNRGKKSLALDLKLPEAKEIIYKLAATCDVVVNNWRVGVLDRLGFGYEQLKQHRPDIIYVTASTFGPQGAWAAKPGRDTLGQAAGGLMHVTGREGDLPLPAGALIADHTAGMVEALAILAALRYRDKTGRGQKVDTSLYGTVIAMQAWEITQRSMAKEEIRRAGRSHSFTLRGAWGAFKTADSYLCMAGVMQDQWPLFCQILGIEELENDPRFATAEARNENGDELQAILDTVFPKKTTREWLSELDAREFLCAPVQTYDDIIDSEQALINGYIRPLEHPVLGRIKIVGVPIGMSEATIEPRGPAPELGQHTEETLLSLGYSWEDIASLREKKVI